MSNKERNKSLRRWYKLIGYMQKRYEKTNRKSGVNYQFPASQFNWDNAEIHGVDFVDAQFSHTTLDNVKFSSTDFTGANFTSSRIGNARFTDCNFDNVNFDRVRFENVLFERCTLNGTTIEKAAFWKTNLGSNLSGLKLPSSIDWLRENFERDPETGYFIVYKAIGDTTFKHPDYWVIEPGAYLRETVCFDRLEVCGSGVNFGTLEYIEANYGNVNCDVWKCYLTGVPVIPIITDGKGRSDELQLIEIVHSYHEQDWDDDDGWDDEEEEDDDDDFDGFWDEEEDWDDDEDDLYPDVYAQNADLYEEDEE